MARYQSPYPGQVANCLTCQQLRRVHCQSTPVVEIKVMEVLSADYLTVSPQHFLIMADKMSTFFWAKKYLLMTTANAVDMLKEIIKIHGCPKLLVKDNGPSFRNDFVLQLRSMNMRLTCKVRMVLQNVLSG